MNRLIGLSALFFAVASVGFAVTCATGPVGSATYVGYGVTGCDIGVLRFSAFEFSITGNGNTVADEIEVTATAAGLKFSSAQGTFAGAGSASASVTYQFTYLVSLLNPADRITGVTATVNGIDASGAFSNASFQKTATTLGGAALDASPVFIDLSNGGIDIYSPNPFTNTDTLTFSPQTVVRITDNIGIINSGGFASILSVENTPFLVVTTIPEPATYGMMATGLLGLAAIRRRFAVK
jgi:hypothetical protein